MLLRSGAPATYPITKETRYDNRKDLLPRRSGADWFGLIAFAALVICSAVLVVRLISTKFLPTGQLLLAAGALLVLSGLHGWVQLPRREKTGGKIACGIVAWCWPPPCSMARWLLVPCSTPSPSGGQVRGDGHHLRHRQRR